MKEANEFWQGIPLGQWLQFGKPHSAAWSWQCRWISFSWNVQAWIKTSTQTEENVNTYVDRNNKKVQKVSSKRDVWICDSTNHNFWGKLGSTTYHSKQASKSKQAKFTKWVELIGLIESNCMTFNWKFQHVFLWIFTMFLLTHVSFIKTQDPSYLCCSLTKWRACSSIGPIVLSLFTEKMVWSNSSGASSDGDICRTPRCKNPRFIYQTQSKPV